MYFTTKSKPPASANALKLAEMPAEDTGLDEVGHDHEVGRGKIAEKLDVLLEPALFCGFCRQQHRVGIGTEACFKQKQVRAPLAIFG